MTEISEIFVAGGTGMTVTLQVLAETMARSAVRTVGRGIGRQLVRGLPGSLFKR